LEKTDSFLAYIVNFKMNQGYPEGTPLPPILFNIVLNEPNQELEERGHRCCRWADDFVNLVRSGRADRRVMVD